MSKHEINSAEERYQSGSGGLVLRNKLEIIDATEMDVLESGLLIMFYCTLKTHESIAAMIVCSGTIN
ncbi:hypothetical protein [Cedecea sp. FDAARGOS_727]|uniref:hypothetical protein n=1 Tax=Cedecea sp. FDAARGOS_727 TaxID=2545798 RepID=UPI001C203AC2|nr:hypothetical protein [Cedecea sp. FDAARGOS_727]